MKVGLITIVDPIPNYGNKLQHYATYAVLKRMNNEVTSYTMEKPIISFKTRIAHIIHIVTRYRFTKQKTFWKYGYKKNMRFHIFNKTKLNIKYIKKTNGLEMKEDIFFVGSDQVWNTNWFNNKKEEMFLLKFIQDNKKKNSFSSSFGTDVLNKKWTERFSKELSKFNYISVREEAGKRILNCLIKREVKVLVDPTMLLTKEEWRIISNKPVNAKEGYVLTYFLSPKCDDASAVLERVKENRKVYELLDLNDDIVGTATPENFIWLFDHADIVLTDSFHACVFSFLFNKPFLVFDRNWNEKSMNSRLETLLSKFNLERKYYYSGIQNNVWEHDYSEGYKQLEMERRKAISFLESVLRN
ncbi:polysaccharide pyruvyl transferase family protein [Ruminococcus sp.]|uniref:polysaccharide pyruvyl transferase family protein n=1 Tax=Ruminococcus sp. TaxID=41978 RepID=UPI0025D55E6C|nr:polysaccharide pyruvyl transferase family protein [Ruminococcus sp.]